MTTRDPTGREPPEGHRLVVLGLRPQELGGYDATEVPDRIRRHLAEIIAAKAEMHADLVVMTGLRLGAEMLAGEAAVHVGARLVVVLPYPDPDAVWSAAFRERFAALSGQADEVITLQAKSPDDVKASRGALARRDAWFARNSHESIVVWDHRDADVGRTVKAMRTALGDDEVWVVDPATLR
ncbi:MAG: SLOG family protein [Acidimicrobiia bacterium]|nr:SLOG family protein [Acidimicrobiia bacterium]